MSVEPHVSTKCTIVGLEMVPPCPYLNHPKLLCFEYWYVARHTACILIALLGLFCDLINLYRFPL